MFWCILLLLPQWDLLLVVLLFCSIILFPLSAANSTSYIPSSLYHIVHIFQHHRLYLAFFWKSWLTFYKSSIFCMHFEVHNTMILLYLYSILYIFFLRPYDWFPYLILMRWILAISLKARFISLEADYRIQVSCIGVCGLEKVIIFVLMLYLGCLLIFLPLIDSLYIKYGTFLSFTVMFT